MSMLGIGEFFEAALPYIIIGIIFYFIFKFIVAKFPNIKFGNKVKPLEDVPRDAMERVKRDLKKSARMSKPPNLRFIEMSGDMEVPRRRMGRIWGVLPKLDYHIVFYRPRGNWRIKTLIVENEFITDSLFNALVVKGRGITVHGILFHFLEPVRGWQKFIKFGDDELKKFDPLQALWLRRLSCVQVMVEKQQMLDRIENRSYLELKAILPKAKIQDIMVRGSRWIDRQEEMEDF